MKRKQYPIRVQKVSDGVYLFNGVKKVSISMLNSELVVRVGGGYVSLIEYIESYILKRSFLQASTGRKSPPERGVSRKAVKAEPGVTLTKFELEDYLRSDAAQTQAAGHEAHCHAKNDDE